MIRRSIPDSDRRLREYAITPTRRATFAAAFREVDDRAKEILTMLPKTTDRAALARGLEALLDAVRNE